MHIKLYACIIYAYYKICIHICVYIYFCSISSVSLENTDKYLIDVYRSLRPMIVEHTFCSSVHGQFSKINHIVDLKTSLDKFKRIGITKEVSILC